MIRKFLMEVEGLRLKPYKINGIIHIGYGRNLEDKGITETEARFLLANDVHDAVKKLTNYFGLEFWNSLPENVRIVLVSMVYNLGWSGFLTFKHFIVSIKVQNYEKAIYELQHSLRAKQLPNRTQKEVNLLKELL